ncbi:hypothetical protein [Deinococcus sp.]|uniref:hypothetical protein n=1 Tax=Deinococcus sp. TaxID=47478 RepID=UPI003CC6112D
MTYIPTEHERALLGRIARQLSGSLSNEDAAQFIEIVTALGMGRQPADSEPTPAVLNSLGQLITVMERLDEGDTTESVRAYTGSLDALTRLDLLLHIWVAGKAKRARSYSAPDDTSHPTLLHPTDALTRHTMRQFREAGIIGHHPDAIRDAAHHVIEHELLPALKPAVLTHTKPSGTFRAGGTTRFPSSFQRSTAPDEQHYARQILDDRKRWEKGEGLVLNGKRPVSVTAVLHNPPGAAGQVVSYPTGTLSQYGQHMTLLSHPNVKYFPDDSHNLTPEERGQPMSARHAAVMAATEGRDAQPLGPTSTHEARYPEGLALGGLDFGQHATGHHLIDRDGEGGTWPHGLSYGAWRVHERLKATKEDGAAG